MIEALSDIRDDAYVTILFYNFKSSASESPTALKRASHLMMWLLGMDVFKKATNRAIDSAGWCRPIEVACRWWGRD